MEDNKSLNKEENEGKKDCKKNRFVAFDGRDDAFDGALCLRSR